MSEQKQDALNPVSLVGSIFKFSIATWLNAVMLVAVIFIANYALRDAEGAFGMYNLFYTATMTVMNIAMLGLDHAYIRFYNEPPKGIKDSRQLAAACMLFSTVSLFALSLLCCLAFPGWVSAIFFEGQSSHTRLVLFICVSAFFQLVTRYFNITYRMQHNVKMYSLQSVLLQFFSRAFYLFGIFINKNIETFIWFNVVGLGVFVLVFFLLQRRSMLPEKVSFAPTAYRPLLQYGVALAPNTVIQWVNQFFTLSIVNRFLGGGALDVITFLSYVSMALGIIQAGFSTFWSAFIFGHYRTEQRKIRRVHDYLTFIMLSLMTVIIMAQPLIFAVFSTYKAGAPLLGLMTYAPMLLIISETTVYGILISKKSYFDSIGMAISLAVTVALCLWLVPQYGLLGIAVATAAAGIAMFVFRTVIAQRYYKSMDNPAKTAVSLLLMLALCIVSWLCAGQWYIVSGVALALLCYYLIVYRGELRRCFDIAKEVLASLRKKTPKTV